jgi:adhesin HecA-like repeat protein
MPSRRGWRWEQGGSRLAVQVDGTIAAYFNNTGSYLTVPAGGVTITAGGLTITAGGLTVTAGGLVVTAGGLTVTAGTLTLGNSAHWTANASATVTISNVAPAGVGTATITKWLTVTDNAGTVMYIPAWT